jgi:energy-coupling factor transporter ATP-binding protein EcfA2
MLKSLHVKNFTVFEDAKFEFGPGLNVIVGANGTGKSQLLKIGYAIESIAETSKRGKWSTDERKELSWGVGVQAVLVNLFLPKQLHDLIRRGAPDEKATITAVFSADTTESEPTLKYSILYNEDTKASSEIEGVPQRLAGDFAAPVLLPTKEILSFYRGFGSILRKYELQFDRSYLDLWDALGLPLLRNPPAIVKELIEPVMQGRVVLEGEEFYFYPLNGERLAINMAAEGIRKLGMLSVLLANGSLTPDTTLFWDEPEANLNPQLIKKLAEILVLLARQKFQIILATHSLFLMRELHILSKEAPTPIQYFGLTGGQMGEPTTVETADELFMLPGIVALDAEMEQADTFLDVLNQDDAGI